ncbi:hypothetical protein [Nannocystis radixulma]|uniref:Uncharacterized protein n=1 Tax=Nannocystis radixulma TaxID=2995305 RepID=A0ABT5BIG5_9BACT|nr:hypothetical protein [Nannocystis radixulma]MDC0672832.1 hypothetical protein [Nannocystis radixulma]
MFKLKLASAAPFCSEIDLSRGRHQLPGMPRKPSAQPGELDCEAFARRDKEPRERFCLATTAFSTLN